MPLMPHRSRRRWQNWSHSVTCEPNHTAYPATLEEIQSEVLRCAEEGERLRVVGAGHSFTPLCASDENQMSLAHFTGIETTELTQRRVWVRAGTRLRRLGQLLAERGLAMENLGDDDQQTLAGAVATGTHGSGVRFGNLATQISALRIVKADGSVQTVDAQTPELLDAARLALGALGVITHLQLQCVDHYRLLTRSRKMPLDEALGQLDDLQRQHRNLELHWFAHTDTVLLKTRDLSTEPAQQPRLRSLWRDYAVDNGARWAVAELTRRVPTAGSRLGRVAAWVGEAPATVREAQRAYAVRHLIRYNEIEYSLPVALLPQLLRQIRRLCRALDYGFHFPLEIRFVRADTLWLSPACRRDSVCISLRCYKSLPHPDCVAALTELFDRHEGRPHWGKQHDKTAAALASLYPRFADFQALRAQWDPRGLFLNPYLASLFGVQKR
jgi:FAD-linked oxidoreductase